MTKSVEYIAEAIRNGESGILAEESSFAAYADYSRATGFDSP